jgi:hypothetical protein
MLVEATITRVSRIKEGGSDMVKVLTLKELGDLDAALKRAGIAMTKNVSVKLGQQSESPITSPTSTESEGSDKPAVKRGPKPRQVESKTTPEATEEKPAS